MSITVEATYENGVFRLAQPLPLKDHEKVRITVDIVSNWVEETAGIMGWTGDAETVERFALDPEFDPQEDS